MTKKKAVIEVKDLTKKFGGFTAVDKISFSVFSGEIVGFLGPNGAGKTTTIQMLLDLVTPTSGMVRMFGKDMKKAREEILNRVNFSSAYVAMPYNLKVWENLATFGRLYGVGNLKQKIKELADFFEITDLLPKMTGSLSSGQATRVNLAKALINDPELLLLDEPTASLDPDVADKTRKLLLQIQKEKGVTVLYTSHNMVEVEEICNRVVFINKGKITDTGTPGELVKKYGHKDLNDVFLTIVRGGEN
ncbi:MAG: ABC transporter ATP-binding protein [Candidatus Blackburnbacteria bacterium RIFCSPHIGHO2_12_FULL_44_25]|nr:MAG: ABC transporter ATP-binding protein [Candidatus Blackburnbacteria bacterium RIFCSPHIGHO2_12_FULL_44_25]